MNDLKLCEIDLVKSLRMCAGGAANQDRDPWANYFNKAANEIERMRAVLLDISDIARHQNLPLIQSALTRDNGTLEGHSDGTRVKTYLQNVTKDWLEKYPQEKWRCDIFPEDWSTHHGVGETEAIAIHNASLAYIIWPAPKKTAI
jgi:hypothetical protein